MLLKKLGFYTKPLKKTQHDISEYSVDKDGNVWSNNDDTYTTEYGKFIRAGEGKDRVVTLRDKQGNKVSISRDKLKKAYELNRAFSF